MSKYKSLVATTHVDQSRSIHLHLMPLRLLDDEPFLSRKRVHNMLCRSITTSFVTVPAVGLELLGFNVKFVCARETSSCN